jgi:integrase
VIVADFVDGEYFAHVSSTLAPSTVDGYRKMWASYRGHLAGRELAMRTCDAQALLRGLCAASPHLTKTTLRHIKNFFSGVWTHAKRMGSVDGNPWTDVAIPSAPEGAETHAYSPEEVDAMLTILWTKPEPLALLVLVAAATGLRKSEIRGLEWSDWHSAERTLYVNRAVWRGHVKTTKSRASKAPVPVIEALAIELDDYAARIKAFHLSGWKLEGYIFSSGSEKGLPLDLDNLARRQISTAVGPVWRGWHAFRRGLATFLHAQGVDDKTIQAILRHENVSVTQKCYVKTVPESVRKAMAAVQQNYSA